jgi:uncharacterized protein YjbI with pentapeptide repeats
MASFAPNDDQLSLLLRGSDVWNEWRRRNPDIRVNLSGALLGGADLSGAYLSGAYLREARLSRADLRLADFSRAYLVGADLHGADLDGTNLNEAVFQETILANIDLTTTIGLDNSHHRSPSSIDFRTLFRSGNLPISF